MEGSSNASGATPEGVRAGDRASLHAVVDRRGPAVVAFCTQVCGPHDATRAAAEAFARFRAAVRDAPDLSIIDPEVLLRGATRHAAASMARVPLGPPPHGRLRSRGTQTCEHVPTMLAARANGALGEADLERLARHLDRCERCDALAEIFHRAELAYQDPAYDTLGTDTSSVLLEALDAVPMQTIGVAPAPDPAAPAGDAIDGAFGHLPDLEDEVPLEVTQVAAPAEEAEEAEAAEEPEAAVELDVEQVPAPAEGLDPEQLAAEPLPEASPEVAESGEYEVVYGETAEWDSLTGGAPVAPTEADADAGEAEDEHVLAPADAPAPGAVLAGGRRRRSGGATRALVIGLPVLLVTAAVVAALYFANVFGGDAGTPTKVRSSAPIGIEAPVTTPLPVTVAAETPSSVTPGATGAGSTTPGTAASSAAPGTSTTP